MLRAVCHLLALNRLSHTLAATHQHSQTQENNLTCQVFDVFTAYYQLTCTASLRAILKNMQLYNTIYIAVKVLRLFLRGLFTSSAIKQELIPDTYILSEDFALSVHLHTHIVLLLTQNHC